MPELPEVETVRRSLYKSLLNKTVQRVIIRQSRLRWPVPENLSTILFHLTIIDIQRRGKYLLFHTTKGALIIHLGMSGSLRLLSKPLPLTPHDHLDIEFTNQWILRYKDPRRFGCILWTENSKKHALLNSLGVEPLSRAFNSKYLYECSRGKKIAIKSFLMNSKIVTGIGNIYANEALFDAGISPARATQKINQDEADQLILSIKKILKRAIKAGGTTLQDFYTDQGQPGYFSQQLYVYGRDGQACKQCQFTLKKTSINQRSSFYCEQCQK